jgi:hypothetical protein
MRNLLHEQDTRQRAAAVLPLGPGETVADEIVISSPAAFPHFDRKSIAINAIQLELRNSNGEAALRIPVKLIMR